MGIDNAKVNKKVESRKAKLITHSPKGIMFQSGETS